MSVSRAWLREWPAGGAQSWTLAFVASASVAASALVAYLAALSPDTVPAGPTAWLARAAYVLAPAAVARWVKRSRFGVIPTVGARKRIPGERSQHRGRHHAGGVRGIRRSSHMPSRRTAVSITRQATTADDALPNRPGRCRNVAGLGRLCLGTGSVCFASPPRAPGASSVLGKEARQASRSAPRCPRSMILLDFCGEPFGLTGVIARRLGSG